jgi:hypothetical protein
MFILFLPATMFIIPITVFEGLHTLTLAPLDRLLLWTAHGWINPLLAILPGTKKTLKLLTAATLFA